MQTFINNDHPKLPSEKGKGLAGSLIVHLGLFLVLVLVGFSAPKPAEMDKGILVNFGTDETGSGLIEPSPASSAEETAPPPQTASEKPSAQEALVTQDKEKEAPEVKKVEPKAEVKKKELTEADKKRQEELEAERIQKANEEAERKRIADEQKRISDISNRTKNALANAKNSGTSSTGEGITGGPGNQGVPTGSVDSKGRGPGSGTGDRGISYELAGRNFKSMPQPKYDYQEEGKVVVEIKVDRNGNVIEAISGVKGSTTLVEYLVNAAKEAAMKAKFEAKPDGPLVQKGSITYNFVLR